MDLVIIGAGPAGLATAIAAGQAGLSYLVIEKGALVNSILHFPRNMVFFTTSDLLEIGGLPFTTPFEKPTRAEALRYYRRVADTFKLQVVFGEEVTTVERGTAFRTVTRRADGSVGTYESDFVVLATGYYDHPNMLNIPGEDLPHVSHYYSEAHPYFRKHVIVVGGKNSAAEAALDLYRSGARVTLVHRGAQLGAALKYWVKPDIENRIKEGAIAARFKTWLVEIRQGSAVAECDGKREEIPADTVFLLTGFHPDVELLRRAGVRVGEVTLAPEYDPETLETNVPGLYLAGAVVSGKETNRIFIENGRFHGEVVVRSLLGKLRA
jgi:thioredoxin reductase (NADPH)